MKVRELMAELMAFSPEDDVYTLDKSYALCDLTRVYADKDIPTIVIIN